MYCMRNYCLIHVLEVQSAITVSVFLAGILRTLGLASQAGATVHRRVQLSLPTKMGGLQNLSQRSTFHKFD